MSRPQINTCFDGRLAECLPGIGIDPKKDVAWPNFQFSPNVKRLYLRPTCMYAEPVMASLGPNGFERIGGIYQISIFEVMGIGMRNAERVAQYLVGTFKAERLMDCCGTKIRIRTAYFGGPVDEKYRLHIPVSVNWMTYVTK